MKISIWLFSEFWKFFFEKRDKIFPKIMAAPDPMIKLFAAVNNNKLKFIDNLRKAVAIKHQKCFYMGWNKTWNDNYGQMGGRWIEKLRDRDVNGIFMISTLLIGQQKSKLEITQKTRILIGKIGLIFTVHISMTRRHKHVFNT